MIMIQMNMKKVTQNARNAKQSLERSVNSLEKRSAFLVRRINLKTSLILINGKMNVVGDVDA